MRNRSFLTCLAVFAIVLAGGLVAAAQVPDVAGLGKTDLGLSVYGAFSQKTTGNGVIQSPSNTAGGLFELRHLSNPIVGFEATYSFNHADQTITSEQSCTGPSCVQTLKANAHEVTADWVPSVHFVNARVFGVLGLGVLLNVPSGSQANAQTSTKPVYVYGAGLDWGVLPHLGVRVQYRGNLYNAPDLSKLYTSSKAFTQTAEPMIGIYFRL